MSYLVASFGFLLAGYSLDGTIASIWLLVGCQFVLMLGEIRRKQVTGAGAFIFMSFLFFSVRPIYLVLEKDHKLLITGYQLRPSMEMIGSAMWWASAALWCFAVGAYAVPRLHRQWLQHRNRVNRREVPSTYFNDQVAFALIGLQVLTLPIIYLIASRAGRSVYKSGFGAYMYDLPVPLHAVHIFAVVVLLGCWLKKRDFSTLARLVISGVILLIFTYLMRDVTIFRGFYVTGVMMAGIAAVCLWKGRVGYAWLIVPIVVLQPFFQYLGKERASDNEELGQESLVEGVYSHGTVLESYWHFYRSNGDMNIFDTFIAAKEFEPSWHPYIWSWLYVPLHFIPRALWQSKPQKGMTMDGRFSKGLPTSPGIAGFFLVDGGLVWMLLNMALLGYFVSLADWFVITMKQGVVQSCLIAILVVTAMFLSRVFLWQYFYQVLYYLIPVVVLSRWASRFSFSRHRASRGRPWSAPSPGH